MKRPALCCSLTVAAILGLVILGLVTVRSFVGTAPKEPRYNGRPLSQWLQDYDDAETPDTVASIHRDQVIAVSESAVNSIGTNAIPTLLAWLRGDNQPARGPLGSLLSRRRYRIAQERRRMACIGFNILGENAQSAAPDLAALTLNTNTEVRTYALSILVRIPPKRKIFLPVLSRLLHDTNPTLREQAAFYMIELFPQDAEKMGIRIISPGVIDFGTNVNSNW
jgi:hypothetical protein